MDTEAPEGVYVWLKTTHKIGNRDDIVDAVKSVIAGEENYLEVGFSEDSPSSAATDSLTRRVFVVRLETDELSGRATSSPINRRLLGKLEGAVDGNTGDDERSNCQAYAMPYPPKEMTWDSGRKTIHCPECGEVTR